MKKVGKRGQKLYKGYPRIKKYIRERAGSKCEVIIDGERCGRRKCMVDHITPRNMAGSKSKWLNDERNLIYLCLEHAEQGRYRTYREGKYRSLQMLYPDLAWEDKGPWREFLS